jgi:hypothetical protein
MMAGAYHDPLDAGASAPADRRRRISARISE